MPNHVHRIIVLTEQVGAIHESPLQMKQYQRRIMKLSKIIGRFKMITAREINILRNTIGMPIWQRGYYERIIRNKKKIQGRDESRPYKDFFLTVLCFKLTSQLCS
jgi:putative transposase